MDQAPIVLEPLIPARACVIWLHGLGASGDDFVPIVPALGLSPEHAVRFVFPHAPLIPVTVNNGMVMRAWYDVLEMSIDRRVDLAGVSNSQSLVENLIEQQIEQGIDARNIVVAGFSQGGAIALQTALCGPRKLAGILALSSYLTSDDGMQPNREDLPIFVAHGTADPIVPLELGEKSRRRLTELGYSPEWKAYPMEHEVCLEEVEAIGAWLRTILDSYS